MVEMIAPDREHIAITTEDEYVQIGTREGNTAGECERTAEPTMVQVLHISNGDSLNDKLQAKGNWIEKLLAANTPDDKLIENVYLAALSRFPTEDEKQKLSAALVEPGQDKRQLVEDLFWSVLSSREFLFNH